MKFTKSMAAERFWTFGCNEGTNKKIRKHQSFKEYIKMKKLINPSRPKGLKGLHKTFSDTTEKCENKNLTYFLFQCNFQKCTGP